METGVEIVGDRNIELQFDRFPEAARANLRAAIQESTAELYELIEAAAPKRTGKLAAMIQQRVTESANRITGSVSVTGDFGKAGALEYGSHKTINMKLSHVFSRIVPTLDVRRTLDIEARNFLRGPEGEIAPGALEKMEEAVQAAVDA